jgi:glutamyl-Q tRNA(Asp) synthetase
MTESYRGRFAPSPTGPLHFGSLVAATASYLDARANRGAWLVRMEDLDRDRVVSGAADGILSDLECFGFQWDGPVAHQSKRTDLYQEAFEKLNIAGYLYPCGCSRKEIADSVSQTISRTGESGGQRYPGTCAAGLAPGKIARSWRVRVNSSCTSGPIVFEDRLHGRQQQDLDEAVGDFILLRADGVFAYQLAVVVDDAAQEITDVVRGADLLDSTARQIYLQQLLNLPTPRYLHIPVATDPAGYKLSKQNRALALDRSNAAALLTDALTFLNHRPPSELVQGPVSEIWNWAISAWSPAKLRRALALPCPPQVGAQVGTDSSVPSAQNCDSPRNSSP